MDTNELMKQLPDFDDMDKLGAANARAKAELEAVNNLLEMKIAKCIQEAMTNPEYWIDGKRPSMSYATNVIAVTGNNEDDFQELVELRSKIVALTEEYQYTKQLLSNMESRIAVWQTHSANRRKASV